MDKKEEKRNKIICILFIIGMFTWLFLIERADRQKLNDCSIITIAYPTKWIPRATIKYNFTLHGKNIRRGETMTYPTMGQFERGKHLLNERFWVKVYCKDFTLSRIYWEAKVPDTLTYVPPNGWSEIPYGLANNVKGK
jgi:hypothetical protein